VCVCELKARCWFCTDVHVITWDAMIWRFFALAARLRSVRGRRASERMECLAVFPLLLFHCFKYPTSFSVG
jgi:hypothetical protein